ncbi:hypothetical protein ACQ4N7_14005 [Nodosilinea sp. AN01ver1]|uniref:hypothetical protein n=1 Tax=Nodosilinea sp. AN01ver1 TaxID=3423362 RepID=UPI003D31EA21
MVAFRSLFSFGEITRSLLLSVALATATEFVFASHPAQANSDPLMLMLEIYGVPTRGSLARQAESAAIDEITRAFNENAQLNSVQVDVLGQLNGRVVPIFSLSVSREQWLSDRQSALQTAQYYYSSYRLLGLDSTDGGLPSQSIAQAPSVPLVSRDPSVQVGEAFRQGRLSPQEYDQLIDALD